MIGNKAAAQQMARIVGAFGVVELESLLRSRAPKPHRWIGQLTKAIDEKFAGKRPSSRTLTRFIFTHPSFRSIAISVEDAREPRMNPASGRPAEWDLPSITTVGDLARWLNLRPEELNWFADVRSLERNGRSSLCHYHRRWFQKKDGKFRLIESPKQRLKAVQRAILREIVNRIPANESCHGFRERRSILTFAQPHASKAVVLKLDLKDFFPTCSFARVQNIFLTAGYPESVALLLAGLCTTICPRAMIGELPHEQQRTARELYLRKHLPQGAPTSPALANLCAFNLDCRLAGLANKAGGTYTRYADDLVFSGDEGFERGVNRFMIHAMAITLEEGFGVNARKTRVMRQGVSQRAAGLTLNVAPNVPRKEFDRLKALLTNCVRFGPRTQNRSGHHNFRAHIEGRVAHFSMINPNRGARLKRIFDKIPWEIE
jgi:RNA-directed DNA polymerase